MEITCLKILAWLEASQHLPGSASENVENPKVNVADAVQDFLDEAGELLTSDRNEAELFGTRLIRIKGCVQDLRNDLQNIEEALRKTSGALPGEALGTPVWREE